MNRLNLYYPVKPYYCFQKFGENQACVINFQTKSQKVAGKVNNVCPAGFEELYPKFGMAGHTGEDLQALHGQLVYSSCEGKVEEIQTEEARGLGIGVVTQEAYDMGQWGVHKCKVRYWHLMSFNVKIGDIVKVGDLLGYADNTGYSAGDHLHFEIKPVEYDYAGNLYNVFQSNGYFGSVNPEHFWSNYYAQDYSTIILIQSKLIGLLQKLIGLLTKK